MITYTKTSFNLSTPTGLMLESVFKPTGSRVDSERIPPVNININDYTSHYINLYTLARNIISSMDTASKKLWIASDKAMSDLKELLDVEMKILYDLYRDSTCELIFLAPDYSSITKKGFTVFSKDNIPRDLFVVRAVLNKHFKGESGEFKLKPNKPGKFLITTHLANDLLNHKYIDLQLLESHTGVLKKPVNFNTKYKKFGSNDMTILPFMERLLYIFNDKGIIKTEVKLATKKLIYDIAVKKRWTYKTSEQKAMFDIQMENSELYNMMLMMKKFY